MLGKFFCSKKFKNYILLFITLSPLQAIAHGTMEFPVSRALNCYKEKAAYSPSAMSEACKAYIATNPNAVYNWNAINQPAAFGNHKSIVNYLNLENILNYANLRNVIPLEKEMSHCSQTSKTNDVNP